MPSVILPYLASSTAPSVPVLSTESVALLVSAPVSASSAPRQAVCGKQTPSSRKRAESARHALCEYCAMRRPETRKFMFV